MDVIRKYTVNEGLTVNLCSQAGIDGYLIIELVGFLDAGIDEYWQIIEAQEDTPKGTIFLLEHLKSVNTAGYGLFMRTIQENRQRGGQTILVGLHGAARDRLSQSVFDPSSLCRTFEHLDDFLKSVRTKKKEVAPEQ